MLDDLALPGDGGCIGGSAAEEGKGPELCGETAAFLGSSAPPRIDDIDMPPEGRCGAVTDDRLARSRIPENGDDVGGPRGADPKIDDVDDEFPGWGGDGGGMLRDANEGGACGGSRGPG
jgi:hypothetical protein